MKLSIEQVEAAARQLARSGRGRMAMRGLLKWMEASGGIGLDESNQEAVLTLLAAVWGPFSGSARDVMRDALLGITPAQNEA